MVKEQATSPEKRKDRFDLDRRLRLHKRIQPIIAWLHREEHALSLIPVAVMVLAHFFDRYLTSWWPLLIFAAWLALIVAMVALWLVWWQNVRMLALHDDITVIAPLLDFASATFLRPRRKLGKQTLASEALVLPPLPGLLARMPAGDGPALTPDQKAALKRLVSSTKYAERLYAPGLRAKIDEIVWG